MSLLNETHEIQSKLATYCRTGQLEPITGAITDRLHNYRRLVFNVVNDALERAYPIFRGIVTDQEWNDLVNDYFINHDPQDPRVWKMPYELYEFCKENNYAEKLNRPFLNDLLYFEWIEIEVHTMPDEIIPPIQNEGDLLDSPVVINPEYRLLHFDYPVHNTPAESLVSNKGDYFVLVYREQENLSVRFFELSAFFTVVFEKMSVGNINGRTALLESGKLFNMSDENTLIQNGLPFLNDLHAQGITLGFRM